VATDARTACAKVATLVVVGYAISFSAGTLALPPHVVPLLEGHLLPLTALVERDDKDSTKLALYTSEAFFWLGVLVAAWRSCITESTLHQRLQQAGVRVSRIRRAAKEIERKTFHLTGLMVPLLFNLVLECVNTVYCCANNFTVHPFHPHRSTTLLVPQPRAQSIRTQVGTCRHGGHVGLGATRTARGTLYLRFSWTSTACIWLADMARLSSPAIRARMPMQYLLRKNEHEQLTGTCEPTV
jgi:hypothetical protein